MESLPVLGHGGKSVPNTFFRRDGNAKELAAVFPGLSYRCDAPLLWYPTRMVVSLGDDILWVQYSYDTQENWSDLDEGARWNWLSEDSIAAFGAAISQRKYERVLLIGKSLGTLAMLGVLSSKRIPAPVKAVWMTPVLSDPDLRKALESTTVESLMIIGTADHYYDAGEVTRIRKNRAVQTMVIEGADHILETKDGTIESIEVMKRVMESIHRFVSR